MTRKIKADDIFTGTEFSGPGNVLLIDDQGVVEAIVPAVEAGEGVEILEGILCPGFINAHCHIELSHLKRKVPQHTGLVDFVQAVMTERDAPDEEKQQAMQDAEEELYNSGTVAIGDICNTTDSIPLKASSKLYWHNFIEISGFVDAAAQKRFDLANDILKTFRNHLSSAICHLSSLSPHAPYSVSKKLFELINEATAGQLISIHNQEAAAENELYQNKSGKFLELYKNFGIDISSFEPTERNSFPSWNPYFNKQQKIISVHNTFIDNEDLNNSKFKIQNSKFHFCLCPNANLYIENTLPPVNMLLEAGCNIILGTDSYASNTQLNIFEEINTLQKHFPGIPLQTMLQWATLNGAMALGIEEKFGSFEKGKQPGIVLINEGSALRII